MVEYCFICRYLAQSDYHICMGDIFGIQFFNDAENNKNNAADSASQSIRYGVDI